MKADDLLKKLKKGEGPQEGRVEGSVRSAIPVRSLLALVEHMREVGRYDWADDTLKGIYDSVERDQFVTAAQLQAVKNIRGAARGFDWTEEGELVFPDLGD